ncbi:MAG: tetratricopeptide repeat protein [Myxococcales bacterium]|nr:tetratricopeptide repeat protein [Myxococcales bacterium]
MTTAALDSVLEQVRALENKGDLAGAIGALQAAPAPMHDRGLWQYARGALAFKQGDLSAAVGHFEKAVELEPEVSEYRSNLGAALLEKARGGDAAAAAKALEVMKAAMRWGPTLPEVHSNYGLALLVAGRNEEALKVFDDALAIDPSHVTARYNRAAALNALERYRDALEALDALLTKVPTHAQALASKQRVLERLGRT